MADPAFLSLLGTAALFTALCVPGFILGKTAAKGRTDAVTGLILQYAAMPALVFRSFCDPRTGSASAAGIAVSALLPAVSAAVIFALSAFVFPAGRDGNARRALRICSVFPNCGFFGIPLAQAVFPDHPEISLYTAVFNVVSTLIYLTLGTFVMSGERGMKSALKRIASAPVLWAAALGLFFSLSGLSELFPSVVSFAALLASVCTPLAMIGLGMSLAESSRSSCRPVSGIVLALVLRLAVSPILAVTLTLPFGDRSLSTAMLIAAGVASAGSIPALIRRYGGDHSLAAVCTFASTLCSVATLPLLYSLMTKLV